MKLVAEEYRLCSQISVPKCLEWKHKFFFSLFGMNVLQQKAGIFASFITVCSNNTVRQCHCSCLPENETVLRVSWLMLWHIDKTDLSSSAKTWSYSKKKKKSLSHKSIPFSRQLSTWPQRVCLQWVRDRREVKVFSCSEIFTPLQHKVTILYLRWLERPVDRYQWLGCYSGRWLDFWLWECAFQFSTLSC